MAWVGQCRMAFESTVKALMLKQKKKKPLSILKEIQKDSDIPLRTLRRWWSEVQSAENGTNNEKEVITDSSDNKNGSASSAGTVPMCACGRRKVRTQAVNGKVKIHSKCWECARKRSPSNNKYEVICPHCGCVHYVTKNDLKLIKKDGSAP